MTSNYLTASRARHVIFPRVFPIGLWQVHHKHIPPPHYISPHSIANKLTRNSSHQFIDPESSSGDKTWWIHSISNTTTTMYKTLLATRDTKTKPSKKYTRNKEQCNIYIPIKSYISIHVIILILISSLCTGLNTTVPT